MGKDVNRITASYRFGRNTTGLCGTDHAVRDGTRQENPTRKPDKKTRQENPTRKPDKNPLQESTINKYCGGSKSWSSVLSQSRYSIFYSIWD